MADYEVPTHTVTNASRADVPPENRNERHVQFNTPSTPGEESDRDNYIYQLEDELQALRSQRNMNDQTRVSQGISQAHPVTSTTTPPVVTSVVETSVPFISQQVHGMSSVPMTAAGSYGYQLPLFSTQQKKSCSFKTFMSTKPPEYSGSSNPSVTFDWLREMEKKFEVVQCDEELKVPYAVQQLRGQANGWWDSATATLTPQQKEWVRWGDFRSELCKHFCSEYDVSRIRREFMELHLTEQMTMDDLINQFTEKLRFVNQWVPDDRTKVEHFVGTLPPHYRTTVRLAGTLPQAFNLARAVDSDIKERIVQNKEKSLQRSKSDTTGRGKQKWQSQPQQSKGKGVSETASEKANWCVRCKARHTGPCTGSFSN